MSTERRTIVHAATVRPRRRTARLRKPSRPGRSDDARRASGRSRPCGCVDGRGSRRTCLFLRRRTTSRLVATSRYLPTTQPQASVVKPRSRTRLITNRLLSDTPEQLLCRRDAQRHRSADHLIHIGRLALIMSNRRDRSNDARVETHRIGRPANRSYHFVDDEESCCGSSRHPCCVTAAVLTSSSRRDGQVSLQPIC